MTQIPDWFLAVVATAIIGLQGWQILQIIDLKVKVAQLMTELKQKL